MTDHRRAIASARGATASLNERARATLRALADVLVPAGDGFPSASDAGVAGAWLDAMLVARPDLLQPLLDLLDEAAGYDPGVAVDRLRSLQPEAFAVLAVVVAGGYFLNPDISLAFGYDGQRAIAIDAAQPPDYLVEGLLDDVIARGPIYR